MAKTIVITQSNYIPWRGYFDLLRSADEVIVFDSVQYTKRDWRNRNVIKTPSGKHWLTIPVEVKGRYEQSIDDARIADPGWLRPHLQSLELNYAKAAAFDETWPWLRGTLVGAAASPWLSEISVTILQAIMARLELDVPMIRCTEVIERQALRDMGPTERLVNLAKARGATRYLSGPAAKNYLDVERFTAEGIEVAWMSYESYPPYPQLWGGFIPDVSIVDLLLNTGGQAPALLGPCRL